MSLPNLWPLWGIAWLIFPRLTVGLILYGLGYEQLGLIISIVGLIFDILGKGD